MDLNKHLANIPFARILLPILPAILLADYVGMTISFYAFVATIFLVILLFFHSHRYSFLLLFCFGLSLLWLQRSDQLKPYSIYDTVCVLTSESDKGEATVKLLSCNGKRRGENLLLLLDKHLDSTLNKGDTLYATILIQEMVGSRVKNRREYVYNGIDLYANLLLERGYHYKNGDKNRNDKTVLYEIRKFVNHRLDRLDLNTADRSLLRAITIGDKTNLDSSLAERYRRSGVSHLLAISGWHIGILFLFLNIVLFFMNHNPKTKLLKLIIILVVIWFYAAITSFSASVARAAIMFSMMQIALLGHVGTNMKFNILFSSAFLLLCFDTTYLYQISFQLSYMAILSIFLFYKPLISVVTIKNRVLRFVPEVLAFTVSAQILTLPIVLYHFGEYSTLSVLANLYMAFLMPILMILTILFVMFPVLLFQQGILIVSDTINLIMNRTLDSLGGYVSGIHFDGYLLFAYYAMILIVLILFDRKEKIIL